MTTQNTLYHRLRVRCPACQSTIDGHTGLSDQNEAAPEPGDLMICVYCSTISVLQSDQSLKLLETSEFEALGQTVQAWLASQQAEVLRFDMLSRRVPAWAPDARFLDLSDGALILLVAMLGAAGLDQSAALAELDRRANRS